MEKRITGIFHRSTSTIRRLKAWGADAGMVADGYTEGGIDQFAFIRVYQLDETGAYIGDMSSNNVGKTITHYDLLKIADLQQPSDGYNLDQVMNWITFGGDPNWGGLMQIVGGGSWETAPLIRMIGAVYAGNLVEVLEQRTFHNVKYGGVTADVPMSRIRTFTAAYWGKTYFTHPHLVHSVMAVGRNDIPHKPRGNVYMPLLFKYNSVWVFDRWLV